MSTERATVATAGDAAHRSRRAGAQLPACCATARRRRSAAAVVKADAYGLGVERVVRRLLREGCRRFFVATAAEARELRALAPDAEIGVFEGALAGTVDALVELDARPVLNTLEQVERWRGRGRALLHLDTGMNRLGLSAADVAALAARTGSARRPRARLRHDASRVRRRARAPHERRAARALRAHAPVVAAGQHLDRQLGRHAASMPRTAAISCGPASRCTAATRSAIGRIRWRAVVTLTAPILQIREIGEPQTVGYGATYVANPPARLAVVGIGYADGYPRSLGNAGTCGRPRPARARRRAGVDGPDLRRRRRAAAR